MRRLGLYLFVYIYEVWKFGFEGGDLSCILAGREGEGGLSCGLVGREREGGLSCSLAGWEGG